MNRQYIRSRSELPGVDAFDEDPLEIPFVRSTKHRDAIGSALRSRSQSFSRRLQVTQAYSTVRWLYPRTIASVKVDSRQRKPDYRGFSLPKNIRSAPTFGSRRNIVSNPPVGNYNLYPAVSHVSISTPALKPPIVTFWGVVPGFMRSGMLCCRENAAGWLWVVLLQIKTHFHKGSA
jgi:hypothetical protein